MESSRISTTVSKRERLIPKLFSFGGVCFGAVSFLEEGMDWTGCIGCSDERGGDEPVHLDRLVCPF